MQRLGGTREPRTPEKVKRNLEHLQLPTPGEMRWKSIWQGRVYLM
jgi:hypothetical protein